MTLAQTRERVAAQLTDALTDVNVYPLQPAVVRLGDGWLVLKSVAAQTFRTAAATFDVLVALSGDEQSAAEHLDVMAVPLLDAVTGLGASTGVSAAILTLDGSDTYFAVANLTVETE